MSDPLEHIPDDSPLVCEDHPHRPATHSLSGVALLCPDCALALRDYAERNGYEIIPLRPRPHARPLTLP